MVSFRRGIADIDATVSSAIGSESRLWTKGSVQSRSSPIARTPRSSFWSAAASPSRSSQSRLANARLAGEKTHLPASCAGHLERGSQGAEFLLASDEARQIGLEDGVDPAAHRAFREYPEGANRGRFSAHWFGAEVLEVEVALELAGRGLRNQDLAGVRSLLQARR